MSPVNVTLSPQPLVLHCPSSLGWLPWGCCLPAYPPFLERPKAVVGSSLTKLLDTEPLTRDCSPIYLTYVSVPSPCEMLTMKEGEKLGQAQNGKSHSC